MDNKSARQSTVSASRSASNMEDTIAQCQRIAEEGNKKYLKDSEERLRYCNSIRVTNDETAQRSYPVTD
jgi:hypothetical protein